MSYWELPHFPDFCSHTTFDDKVMYDTMVRIAGSYVGFAEAFKAVAVHYGWTHVVVVSDEDAMEFCWFIARSFDVVFNNDKNYTFKWLRFGVDPDDSQLDDILRQIRSLTRGFTMLTHKCHLHCSRMTLNSDAFVCSISSVT